MKERGARVCGWAIIGIVTLTSVLSVAASVKAGTLSPVPRPPHFPSDPCGSAAGSVG